MKLSSYKALQEYLVNFAQDDLITVVYVSDLTKKTKKDNSVFEHIRYHSSSFNKEHNIKGFLCNDQHHFIQCLEGKKRAILPLMFNIFNDNRHTNVQVTLVKPIKHYHFSSWHMRSLFLEKNLADNTSLKSTSDASSDKIKFRDFLPFEPHHWPSWMLEHFIKTMQKFENSEHVYPMHLIKYDTVCEDNVFVGVFVIIIGVVFLALLMMTKAFY